MYRVRVLNSIQSLTWSIDSSLSALAYVPVAGGHSG